MTTPSTEWPSTPIPAPVKNLLSRFYILGDNSAPESGRQLGEEIFTPDGQIVVNKRAIYGAEGTALNFRHFRKDVERVNVSLTGNRDRSVKPRNVARSSVSET
jgi:hypothetical protein